MRRGWALVVSAVVVAAVAFPAAMPRHRDSFPLSFYPMYAQDRPAVIGFPTAVLRLTDGGRERLSMEAIGNTDDPLIATALVRDAIRAGEAAVLCVEIAARSSGSGTIEVVTEQHNLVEYFNAGGEPLEVVVHATCEVTP